MDRPFGLGRLYHQLLHSDLLAFCLQDKIFCSYFPLDCQSFLRYPQGYAVQLLNQAYLLESETLTFCPLRQCSPATVFIDYKQAIAAALDFLCAQFHLISQNKAANYLSVKSNYQIQQLKEFITDHAEQLVIVPASYDMIMERANLILGVVSDLAEWEIRAVD